MPIFAQKKLRRAIDIFMSKFVNENSDALKAIDKKTHDPILFAIDHYFLGATYSTPEVRPAIHSEEYEAYLAGYDWNERFGGKKNWD